MKKIIKSRIFYFILGVMITGSIGVYAATTYLAKNVTYKNTTVEAALNDLYSKVDNKAKYTDSELNGADPVYSSNLIPVTIEVNGTVKKADITKKWYSYKDKEWANVVMLNDYRVNYDNGATIPSSNIKAYFVWIPRYSYELFDLGEYDGTTSSKPSESIAHTINIKFGTGTTKDGNTKECTTPLVSGEKGECKVGDYMTHPAFINMNSNGIWVGKFETTGSISNLTVLPNETSLRDKTVKEMFDAAYSYSQVDDSHMMKNTEWGAVAYLSHSKYGINKEVRINNNKDYKTGYASTTEQTVYPGTNGNTDSVTKAYNTETGYLASTTGNITGIYDMSGGSWEYMAAYMKNNYKDSGFNATSIANYSKYIDEYNTSSDVTKYKYRILGDATGEMGQFYNYNDNDNNPRNHNNWYADYSDFVESGYPWFLRSGGYDFGGLAGQFYFARNSGGANVRRGFRLVLVD